ncbi:MULTISPECIES: DUF3093 domain-containing protein [unclassified Diaminobutyricimonas]|uniref:DUF3093 domain-containing protein n=1 Tax=unclassified Diaminobutyricimonas TaxID=2643261 RepID=UPI0012F4CE02|nr:MULTISPECIES: DUF3093 domain-containing protein [unclassified Diaminobutyricimonas]
MILFRERLWPSAWMYLASALVIPASILVFLPINLLVGIITGIVLYIALILLLIAAAPTVTVSETVFKAGRASLPLELAGEVTAHDGEDARQERGPRLDARAWLLIRGWVSGVVRIELLDDSDPVPYWIVSTRHPEALVEAIGTAKSRAA